MKKILFFLLVLAMLLAPVSPAAAAEPIGGSARRLATAQAAVLYELNTDTFVYTWNADAAINPTGMVKFLTAWLALETGELDAMVTVRREVLDTVAIGSVSSNLAAGEMISLRDLLYCVMVSSGNDAAAVIADFVGGSQAAFVEKMNAKARSIGCTGSHFTNAHGLDDPQQYSTARDLAIIVREALKNEAFAEMFGAKSYTVPATNKSPARELKTTNYMLTGEVVGGYVDERVTGGKPAAATTKDRSVICTAQQGTSRYLCVVMSAEAQVTANGLSVKKFTNFVEASELLDYGFGNFSIQQVLDGGQSFRQHTVANGENAVVVSPKQDIFAVLPKKYDPSLLQYIDTVDPAGLTAPIAAGDSLGAVEIRYGSIVVGSCELVAMHGVAVRGTGLPDAERIATKPGTWEKFVHILKWIGRGVLVLALIGIVLFLYLRIRRSAKVRQQHLRRMRSRRRQ